MNFNAVPSHVARHARRLRFVGWWFLLLGLIIVIQPIAVLLDPAATMMVDGVPRKEFLIKLGVVLFVFIAPTIGALIVFTPNSKLETLISRFDRIAKSFVAKRLQGK